MSSSSTLKLHNLTSASNRMLMSLLDFSSEPTFDKTIKDLEELGRRSYIMSLLYKRCIVAVAGLQGVGKSTLMSNLYNFEDDDSPFLGNQGQGETLPILITESKEPGKYFIHKVVRVDGTSSYIQEEINDVKVFREKAHKYDNREDLLLEVTVPHKVFNCSDRSFLLLPGFQKESSYLKDLTYAALRSSMNCLVLFNQPRYANKDNKELIATLNTEFFEASPIFTVTWSDNEDDNVELAETVQRDLNIREGDRVIRTGSPGPQGWREKLTCAVREYSIPTSGVLQIQKNNIDKLIDDYNSVISDIKVGLRNFGVDMKNKEYLQVDRIQKEFHRESEDIKKELKDVLEKVYKSYFSRIKVSVENELIKQYGGWNRYLKGIGQFFATDIEIRKELEDLVKTCSEKANTTVEHELLVILNQVSNEFWTKYSVVMNLPTDENTKIDKRALLCGKEEKNEFPLLKDALNDVFLVLNPEKTKPDFSSNLEFNVRLLPLLTLESYRVNRIIALGLTEGRFPKEAFTDSSLLKHYQENKKEVALGIGVLFGMDIVEGGGIDLFGLLQHNAVNGGAAMAAASFNWALAVVVAGAAVVYMVDQMSKSVNSKAYALSHYIDGMRDCTIESILTNYDRGMERFENIVHDCLVRRYGLHENFANVQNCYSSLKYLEETKREINKSIKGEKWVS